jgi:hypothetical protein
MDNPGEKKCSKCGEVKPKSEFSKKRARKDGLQNECRLCQKIIKRNYRKTKIGKQKCKESRRRYYINGGKEVHQEYIKINRKKRLAKSAVYSAVRGKLLPKVVTLKCNDCGEGAKEYHHESYKKERWLDVIPLCRICHRERHNGKSAPAQPQTKQLSLF